MTSTDRHMVPADADPRQGCLLSSDSHHSQPREVLPLPLSREGIRGDQGLAILGNSSPSGIFSFWSYSGLQIGCVYSLAFGPRGQCTWGGVCARTPLWVCTYLLFPWLCVLRFWECSYWWGTSAGARQPVCTQNQRPGRTKTLFIRQECSDLTAALLCGLGFALSRKDSDWGWGSEAGP